MIRSFRSFRSFKSFKCKETQQIHERGTSRRFPSEIHRRARRKMLILDAATTLETLKVPPGNHLEKLKGDRLGQYSVRIDGRWRVCFEWRDGDAHQVEIVDYH